MNKKLNRRNNGNLEKSKEWDKILNQMLKELSEEYTDKELKKLFNSILKTQHYTE